MFCSDISATKDQAKIEHRESGMVVVDNLKYRYGYEDNKHNRQMASLYHASEIVRELERIEDGLQTISYETNNTLSDERKAIYARSIAAALIGFKDPVLVEVLKKGLEIYSHLEKV